MRRVCIFCGAQSGRDGAYRRAAEAMGGALARRRLGLVYGGGNVGLMGAVADAALAAGGEAIGVLPEALEARELAHSGLTELRIVATMHERKATMADLSDGFVALPGGMGTLEETAEVLTWAQLGMHRKPVGLLDVQGYWAPLVRFLDHAVDERFLRPEHRALLIVEAEPERMLDRLEGWEPPPIDRWMRPRES